MYSMPTTHTYTDRFEILVENSRHTLRFSFGNESLESHQINFVFNSFDEFTLGVASINNSALKHACMG